MAKITCPKCNIEAITIEKRKTVTFGGIIGAIIFIAAMPFIFINLLIGILLMILGVLIGSLGRAKYIELICPNCEMVLGKIE